MRFDVDRKDVITISRLIDTLSGAFPRRSEEIKDVCIKSDLGIVVELCSAKKERTRRQEKYYRKWCGEVAKHCGMTPDEMHEEMLCAAFGSEEVKTKFGMRRRPLQRSGESSVGKYAELIDTLIRVAGEMGFVVPMANEY